MNTTTWNNRSVWQKERSGVHSSTWDEAQRRNTRHSMNELDVVEERDRTYVVSHAGILQKQSGLLDVMQKVSKGVIIIPLIVLALAIPVVLAVWSGGSYLLVFFSLAHLVLIATVLAVWAIAVSYLDMKRGEESLEARPMTGGDGDPSMGARTLPAKEKFGTYEHKTEPKTSTM